MSLSYRFALASALFTAVPMLGVARTQNAIATYANPGDAACFHERSGGIFNQCTTKHVAFFPTAVDSSGCKTVYVRARSNDSSKNVCCHAIATDSAGEPVSGSNWACLPAFGSAQWLSMTGGCVPSYGTMYVYCEVDAGAKVATVNLKNP